jgi:geranylgeranyl transferase type-2 subunit beta
MAQRATRRQWLGQAAATACGLIAGTSGCRPPAPSAPAGPADHSHGDETWAFIGRCRRPDGAYAASPDPDYAGNSDTKFSDLAAVTYAAVLAKTLGRSLPEADRSAAFVQRHQQAEGRFINLAGKHDPKSDLAVLYNTTQAVVCLRALGGRPERDPTPVIERFFARGAFRKLPWYTTSFFPLFYAALGKPFPPDFAQALADHLERNQTDDGYVGDHVAAAFHLAHFYRLLGRPTPRAERMLARVLHDQKPDGGWNIKEPDWDVHACFDAVFILRQLGGDRADVRAAIQRGADWSQGCRNADGGFGHFPDWHSDMDAVYFQMGTLIQAGRVPGVRTDLADSHTLGWGHAMQPGRRYQSAPTRDKKA